MVEEEKKKTFDEWKDTKEQKRCKQWEEDYIRAASDIKEQRRFKELEPTRIYFGQERKREHHHHHRGGGREDSSSSTSSHQEKEREKKKSLKYKDRQQHTPQAQYPQHHTSKDKYSEGGVSDRSSTEDAFFPLDMSGDAEGRLEEPGSIIMHPTNVDNSSSDEGLGLTTDSDASDEEDDRDVDSDNENTGGSGGSGGRSISKDGVPAVKVHKSRKKPKTYRSAEDVLAKLDQELIMNLHTTALSPLNLDDGASMPRCGSFSSVDDHFLSSSIAHPSSPPPPTRIPSSPPLETSSSMQDFPVARRNPISVWKGGAVGASPEPSQQPQQHAVYESGMKNTRRGTALPVVQHKKAASEDVEVAKARNKSRPYTVDTPSMRRSPYLTSPDTSTSIVHASPSSEEAMSGFLSPKEDSERESERESEGRSEGETPKLKRKKIRRKKGRGSHKAKSKTDEDDEDAEGSHESERERERGDGERERTASTTTPATGQATSQQGQQLQPPQQQQQLVAGRRKLMQEITDDQATCLVIFGSEISNNVCLSILTILLFVYVFARYLS